METMPMRHKLKTRQLRSLSTKGIPLALAALLAACGGGEGGTSSIPGGRAAQ